MVSSVLETLDLKQDKRKARLCSFFFFILVPWKLFHASHAFDSNGCDETFPFKLLSLFSLFLFLSFFLTSARHCACVEIV